MNKEISLAICGTLLVASLALNFFQLRGYAFLPPATHDEQLSEARRLIAEDTFAPEKSTKKGK